MAFFGDVTDILASHGPITDISKILISCFMFCHQKYTAVCALRFFAKTSKIRIYELKFFKCSNFSILL